MAAIIHERDINKAFTKVVNKYLAQGLEIHVAAMGAHQLGDIAKVDLTDGADVYRVRVFTETAHALDWSWVFDTAVVTVEKFAGKYSNTRRSETLWNGEGETVECLKWYKIGRNSWTASLKDAMTFNAINNARHEARRANDREFIGLTEKKRDIITSICHRTRGYKAVKGKDIKEVEIYRNARGAYYMVRFNNGKSALEIRAYT